jgi:eukaryotic-like serine/threonine-protein kinase
MVPPKCVPCGTELAGLPACSACGTPANVGRVIAEKYRVDAPLGSGGMSNVYRATQLVLGVPVAIKFLHLQLAFDPLIRERFRREALALAHIRHPGIVSLLDFGETDGELYTVMELLQGRTLVAPDDGMPLTEAGPLFDQVLAALETCHATGVVHRDVKPSNVMVTTVNGVDHAKLIDFGLARTVGIGSEKLTVTGLIQGTPRYMAPEQCRGDHVGPPADIYAMGVLMYEILTGRDPFPVGDPATLMAHHLFLEPTSMREHVPSISEGVEALVLRAMAKDADRRPTATELRSDLAAVLQGIDPHSLTEARSLERRRAGTLSRQQRSITGPAKGGSIAPPVPSHVLVWMPSGPRASALGTMLGAAGLSSSLVSGDALDGPFEPDTLVVASARHDGLTRLERLRAQHARLPVVVVDVRDLEEASVLIRAGVSDFSLEDAPDTELGTKIQRLLRRRQRGQASRGS